MFGKFTQGENDYLRVSKELENLKMHLQKSEKEKIVSFNKPIIVKKKSYICHYCGLEGHIRPYCYDWLDFFSKRKVSTEKFKKQKECQIWRPIVRRSFVAHTAYNAHHSTSWYLDSGCSKHMTGDMSLFVSIENVLLALSLLEMGIKGKFLEKAQLISLVFLP